MAKNNNKSAKKKDKTESVEWTPYFTESMHVSVDSVYEIKEQLGDGGFSIVKRGVRAGQEFAIKMIKKRKVSKEDLEREVSIWRLASSSSDRVVHLYNIYEDARHVNLVMELMTGGELFGKIVEMADYSEAYAAKIMKQVFYIIKDLHKVDIVHQDLKPENLLLVAKDSIAIKLCDFGLAEIAGDDIELVGIVGSTTYMAPEVVAETGHGKPVDVYAAGVIMYILLCGYPPFEPENGITELEFPEPEWDEISVAAKELIGKLLHSNPDRRPTAEQILKDHWFIDVETMKAPNLAKTIRTLRKYNEATGKTSIIGAPIPGSIGPAGASVSMRDYRGEKRASVFGLFEQRQDDSSGNTSLPSGTDGNRDDSALPAGVDGNNSSSDQKATGKASEGSESRKMDENTPTDDSDKSSKTTQNDGSLNNSASKATSPKYSKPENNPTSGNHKKHKKNKKKQRHSVAYDMNVTAAWLKEEQQDEKGKPEPKKKDDDRQAKRASITFGRPLKDLFDKMQSKQYPENAKASSGGKKGTATNLSGSGTSTTISTAPTPSSAQNANGKSNSQANDNNDDHRSQFTHSHKHKDNLLKGSKDSSETGIHISKDQKSRRSEGDDDNDLDDEYFYTGTSMEAIIANFQKDLTQQREMLQALTAEAQNLSQGLLQETKSRVVLEQIMKEEIDALKAAAEEERKERRRIQIALDSVGSSITTTTTADHAESNDHGDQHLTVLTETTDTSRESHTKEPSSTHNSRSGKKVRNHVHQESEKSSARKD